MKRLVLTLFLMVGIIGSASAQHDDLYFVPKKKKVEQVEEKPVVRKVEKAEDETLSATAAPAKLLEMDEDTYNRRGSYLTEQGDAVSEFAMDEEGFVLITEEGDTMWMNTDTLRLTRVMDDKGWVNGFDGSDSDYEYAMRIIRFRSPRYAIPVSSPLYWDVVYGGALWPSWEWNVYDDGVYAYVFPTRSNWYYWDYMMSYPYGWNAWGSPWMYHHGYHWGYHYGLHYGYHYGHVWYDPWFNPYFHGYHPGWHHGHHHAHHPHHPHFGAGGSGWGGGHRTLPNHRTPTYASTGRSTASTTGTSRTGVTSGRTGGDATRRLDNGSGRNSSVRVVTGSAGAVRSSRSGNAGGDEVVRRSTGTSSVSRSSAAGSASRSSYTSQGVSRSGGATSSYSRSSSSSSSSVSRSSSSNSSSRSSYSSGSSSRSSYSSSSYSGGSSSYSSGSSRSSYGGGGSYSGSSSRSGGSRR